MKKKFVKIEVLDNKKMQELKGGVSAPQPLYGIKPLYGIHPLYGISTSSFE